MDVSDGEPPVSSISVKMEKKKNSSKEKVKKMRHSGGGKIPIVVCKHRHRSSRCLAHKLTKTDIQMNFECFYNCETKVKQDQELLNLITVNKVQRRRKKVEDEEKQRDREVANEYYLLRETKPLQIPVCKATFCSVLCISKNRVSRVAKYYAVNATARPELRGGARKRIEYKAEKQPEKEQQEPSLPEVEDSKEALSSLVQCWQPELKTQF